MQAVSLFLRRAAFVALLAAGLLPTVQAMPVLWTLQNVVFDDGGTVTGSFFYDADIQDPSALSGLDITTTPGSAYGGNAYTSLFNTGLPNWIEPIEGPDPNPVTIAGLHALALRFVLPMTNAGGTIAIDTATTGDQEHQEWVFLTNDPGSAMNLRSVTAGSISAVPAPAAAWLLGTAGLGLMGWARRRQLTV